MLDSLAVCGSLRSTALDSIQSLLVAAQSVECIGVFKPVLLLTALYQLKSLLEVLNLDQCYQTRLERPSLVVS